MKNIKFVVIKYSEFFSTSNFHTATPLRIAYYVAFRPPAATHAATAILIIVRRNDLVLKKYVGRKVCGSPISST